MNAKLCKQLRRVARDLQGSPVTDKNHLAKDVFGVITLDPRCGRAAYRRLKKEFRK